MKKVLAMAMAVMLVTASAHATFSRTIGFGKAAVFVSDSMDLLSLPSEQLKYADLLMLELGGPTNNFPSWGGYDMMLEPNMIQGIIPGVAGAGVGTLSLGGGVLTVASGIIYQALSGFAYVPGVNFGLGGGGSAQKSFSDPENQLFAGYAMNVGDMELGLTVQRSVDSYSDKAESAAGSDLVETNSSDMGIGLGLGLKELGPISSLQAGLTLNLRNDLNTDDNGGTVTDKAEQTGMALGARIAGKIDGEDGKFQKINVALSTASLKAENKPNTAPAADVYVKSERSALNWELGWAAGKAGEAGMGLVGLTLGSNGTSRSEAYAGGNDVNKEDNSLLSLKAVVAAELKAKEWLKVRAGYSSSLYASDSSVSEVGDTGATVKSTDVYSNDQNAWSNTDSTISIGTSVIIGDLTFDTVLNQDILLAGPYLVSGVPAMMNWCVSATYAFGGGEK